MTVLGQSGQSRAALGILSALGSLCRLWQFYCSFSDILRILHLANLLNTKVLRQNPQCGVALFSMSKDLQFDCFDDYSQGFPPLPGAGYNLGAFSTTKVWLGQGDTFER